ncbi:MAG: FtsX-like permease family protein, partial [SAR324 cluster bacterium]|nr:FtsX-like permease family protein [SAR324 cluster bacterium]
GFEQEIPWASLGIAVILGTVGSLIFCLPVLVSIHYVQPIVLLRDTSREFSNGSSWKLRLLSYIPGFVVYGGLAVWVAGIIRGGIFLLLLSAAMILLALWAWFLFKFCGYLSYRQRPVLKIALRSLNRNRIAAISCFLSMSLGTLLVNLIPQLQEGITEEIERPDSSRVPTFFIFDIQEEQVQGLEDLVIQQGFELENLSPMVRARLSTINGQVYKGQFRFDSIRDKDMERMLRARIHNLSYLFTDQPVDNIIDGSPLLGRYDPLENKPVQISLEKRWADWREIKVGDRIVFDVAGIPIETEVKNLRKVVWTTFQPAFFILIQQGILEDAPKVFLGSIKNIPIENRLNLQNKIVQTYPNISVIDVTRLVERIFRVIDKITIAVNLMAYLAILAGLVVLYSIARHEVQSRIWEMNLLKTLGARFSMVMSIVQAEFVVLAFFAAVSGLMISLFFSWIISWVMFDNLWTVNWLSNIGTMLGVVILSLTTATIAAHKTLKQKPLALLQTH